MAKASASHRRKNLDVTIGVRFSTEEADAIRRMAVNREMSASDFVREAVKAYMEPAPVLSSRVISQDYGMRGRLVVPQAQSQFGEGFNRGPSPVTVSLAAV